MAPKKEEAGPHATRPLENVSQSERYTPFCDNLTELNNDQQGLITAVNAYTESGLRGKQLVLALCEDYGSEDLFKPSLLELPLLFRYLKDWLEKHGVTIENHSSNRIIPRLCMTIFKQSDQTTGLNCIKEYRKTGATSKSIDHEPKVIERTTSNYSKEENTSKIAHNIAIRFKDKSAKFSGNIYENWKSYLSEYLNACSDYSVPIEKRVQFMYHILREDARNFFDEKIQGRIFSFGEACNLMDREYNSYTRQSRIRNELSRLRIATTKGSEDDDIEALQHIHSKISKLYLLGPPAYRTESHKIDYLRNAVIGTTWAAGPLSRMSTTCMTYQELYAQLESSIQNEKDTKQALAVDHAARLVPKTSTPGEQFGSEDTPIPGVMFAGQARYGRHPDVKSRQCFNCGSTAHLIKDCPKKIDISNRGYNHNNRTRTSYGNQDRDLRARRILFEVCQQLAIEQDEPEDQSEPIEGQSTNNENGSLPAIANQLFSSAFDHSTKEIFNTNIEEDDF